MLRASNSFKLAGESLIDLLGIKKKKKSKAEQASEWLVEQLDKCAPAAKFDYGRLTRKFTILIQAFMQLAMRRFFREEDEAFQKKRLKTGQANYQQVIEAYAATRQTRCEAL